MRVLNPDSVERVRTYQPEVDNKTLVISARQNVRVEDYVTVSVPEYSVR